MTDRVTHQGETYAVRWALAGAATTGVIAGLLWFQFWPTGPATPAIEAAAGKQPSPPAERPHVFPLESERKPIDASPAESGEKQAATPAREAPLPPSESETEISSLPSLRRCLLDPELNPEGLDCPNPAARDELESLINDLNKKAYDLWNANKTIENQIAVSKVEKGLDPPESWSSIPPEQIITRCTVARYINGQMVSGGTVIRKGEHPELEEVRQSLADHDRKAREKLKGRINSLCGG